MDFGGWLATVKGDLDSFATPMMQCLRLGTVGFGAISPIRGSRLFRGRDWSDDSLFLGAKR